VLQAVDLATLAGVDDLAAAAAEAEGLAQHAADVAAAARRAAASAPVRSAVGGKHWREMPVGAEVEGVALEGFVDLLADTDAGLRVVDYKTDRIGPAKVEARFRHYALQGGAYALLVNAVTGRPVLAVDFVFSDAGEVRTLTGADLEAAIEEVRRRLREGAPLDEEPEGREPGRDERQPEGEPLPPAEARRDDSREGEGLEDADDQLGLPL
jgi:RecB family exonuclease